MTKISQSQIFRSTVSLAYEAFWFDLFEEEGNIKFEKLASREYEYKTKNVLIIITKQRVRPPSPPNFFLSYRLLVIFFISGWSKKIKS